LLIDISKTIADRGKCRRPSFFRVKSSKKVSIRSKSLHLLANILKTIIVQGYVKTDISGAIAPIPVELVMLINFAVYIEHLSLIVFKIKAENSKL
jgi:hypothetical protein